MPRRLTAAQHDRIQAEHRARFDTETALLLPAVRAALGTYLAALNRRVDQSAFGLAAPAPVLVAAGPIAQPTGPDPHQFTTGHAEQLQAVFDHAAPEWSAALQTSLVPGIKGMLGRIPLPANHPDVITAAESWRTEWLAQRTQELVGVPDTITASIRAELDRLATEQGTSVFDAKNAVKDLLSPDRLDWEAQRIARTEVVSANNSSMLASWRALISTMGAGVTAKKTWVGGQRPTHSAVSGTTIGIDEKFHVGNAEMDGPGDTAGGPGETVNCACSLSFEIDDAPTTTDTAAGDAGAAEEGDAAGEGDAAAGEGEHTADGEHADAGGLFGPSFDFGAQTDDALAGMLSDAGASGDEASMNRILDELDRRDAAATADAEPGGTLSAEDVAKNARYEQLVREGADPEHAFADAYGVGQEKDVIKTAIGHLKSLGYKGRGWEQLTQSVFKEEAERMYQLAQSLNETKGFMLTKEAAAKGIDPRSLFTGPESRARKYASDELRQFWQKYTRITIEDVRAGILGGTLRAAGTAAWL